MPNIVYVTGFTRFSNCSLKKDMIDSNMIKELPNNVYQIDYCVVFNLLSNCEPLCLSTIERYRYEECRSFI